MTINKGQDMHASMERLHKVSGNKRKIDIANDLKVSASTVTNWGSRGVSKEGALDAGLLYGVDANYILTGAKDGYKNQVEILTGMSSDDHKKSHILKHKDDMPVVEMISVDSYSRLFLEWFDGKGFSEDVDVEKLGWIKRLDGFSANSFALVVVGHSMMPEFKAGDYACVEPHTDVDGISISDGDFVVAQHKGAKYAVIKKVVLGNSKGDFYLTQLNKDIPSDGAISINDYTLIGIIRNKITSYW